MRYHETELVHSNEYKLYCMCNEMKQHLSKLVMLFTQIIFKEGIMDVGLPPKPNLFLHEIISQILLFGIIEFNSCLF